MFIAAMEKFNTFISDDFRLLEERQKSADNSQTLMKCLLDYLESIGLFDQEGLPEKVESESADIASADTMSVDEFKAIYPDCAQYAVAQTGLYDRDSSAIYNYAFEEKIEQELNAAQHIYVSGQAGASLLREALARLLAADILKKRGEYQGALDLFAFLLGNLEEMYDEFHMESLMSKTALPPALFRAIERLENQPNEE